jgi:hypothetical protein
VISAPTHLFFPALKPFDKFKIGLGAGKKQKKGIASAMVESKLMNKKPQPTKSLRKACVWKSNDLG